MNILDRIQGIIDYDTCDMQIDERDALRADLSVISKAVQQQAEQIQRLKKDNERLNKVLTKWRVNISD